MFNLDYDIIREISYKLTRYELRGACAHAHVRCAVARVRVRAKSILESVQDVRGCGPFLGVRCAIALLHTFAHFLGKNCQKMLLFVLKTILEL